MSESSRRPSESHPFLEKLAGMREVLRQGQELMPVGRVDRPDFDLHEQRLVEIEAVFREAKPGFEAVLEDLHVTFMLEMQADMAAAMMGPTERLVRFTDEMSRKFEEKKFEMSEKEREGLESILIPYHAGIREEMLGTLPIDIRRDIEAARLAAEGEEG